MPVGRTEWVIYISSRLIYLANLYTTRAWIGMVLALRKPGRLSPHLAISCFATRIGSHGLFLQVPAQ